LRKHSLAGLTACAAFFLLSIASAPAAAQIPQPVVLPATTADFMSHYDFWLTAAALQIDNERFSWDTNFGGALDIVDYVAGRTGIRVNYQAGLGDEFRAFDPNQGNYTLEANASVRAGANTEFVGVFHHVSRHLSDRPKREAIAWNVLGLRVLQHAALGDLTVDADLEGGPVVQHSTVDYKWIGELSLVIRKPVAPRVGLFLQGSGQIYGVDGTVNNRGNQFGGYAEAGVRIGGRAGNLELFAGVEQRVDAYPIGVGSQQWVLAGFRLLSR
jgi:hypothetical protein